MCPASVRFPTFGVLWADPRRDCKCVNHFNNTVKGRMGEHPGSETLFHVLPLAVGLVPFGVKRCSGGVTGSSQHL